MRVVILSTFTYRFTKFAFQFKAHTKLLTVLLGRRRCHLLMGTIQEMQDLFPLTHEEQAGVAGPSALLSFSVMTATVLWRIPLLFRVNTLNVQLMIPAAFCQLPGSKETVVWACSQTLRYPFSGWLFYFWAGFLRVCTPAAETADQHVFRVLEVAWCACTQNWSPAHRCFYSSSEPVCETLIVLVLDTYLIKGMTRMQQLYMKEILWRSSKYNDSEEGPWKLHLTVLEPLW